MYQVFRPARLAARIWELLVLPPLLSLPRLLRTGKLTAVPPVRPLDANGHAFRNLDGYRWAAKAVVSDDSHGGEVEDRDKDEAVRAMRAAHR